MNHVNVSPSNNSNDDPFWHVALSYDAASPHHQDEQSSSDDDDEIAGTAIDEYQFRTAAVLNFRVRPLPNHNSIINAPVGANVWNGALLLCTWLIEAYYIDESNNNNDSSLLSRRLRHVLPKKLQQLESSSSMHVLELGSGAVGLLGMVLATILEQKYCNGQHTNSTTTPHKDESRPSVTLTDASQDHNILENLTANINTNKRHLYPHVDTTIQALDWGDFSSGSSKIAHFPLPQHLDLVIGTELVYTDETARGCRNVVQYLLEQYPDVTVMILQVMDRPGFEDIFVSYFRDENEQYSVEVQHPLDVELFDLASRVRVSSRSRGGSVKTNPMGGALDRFAYGLVVIRNRRV